jgi:hypothetical protein
LESALNAETKKRGAATMASGEVSEAASAPEKAANPTALPTYFLILDAVGSE